MPEDIKLAKASDVAPKTHTHAASAITESTTKSFVSDTEKSSWNNKLPLAGGQLSGAVIAKPSGNTRQIRNITISATEPTSTTGYEEGDLWLVVP